VDPVPILALIVAVAYVVALGPTPTTRRARGQRRWKAAAFLGALLVIVLALGWPVDGYAARFQWVHMAQHLLLIVVAAPLLVLADPWLFPMRLLPRRLRGSAGSLLFRHPRTAGLRRAGAFLAGPLVAWIAFHAVFLAFHVPALYDLTLRSHPVHDAEHALFLGLAVLLWTPVIRRGALGMRERLAYLMAAGSVGSALGAWLATASVPLYTGFPGSASLSALSDQRLAAGMMAGPGSVVFALAAGMLLYHWLGDIERAGSHGIAGGRSA
jgi:cytochrome c oxidase assembly factor CtaG